MLIVENSKISMGMSVERFLRITFSYQLISFCMFETRNFADFNLREFYKSALIAVMKLLKYCSRHLWING